MCKKSNTAWIGRLHIKRNEIAKAEECLDFIVRNTPDDSFTVTEHLSRKHVGQRGFFRIWFTPGQPEVYATAEAVKFFVDFESISRRAEGSAAAR